jgi:lysine 6-dehydrogenase
MKILLLGVGMQGKAALHDLAQSEEVDKVIAADRDFKALKAHVASRGYGDKVRCEYVNADKHDSISHLMEQQPDVVIDLLPVRYCSQVATAAINHGVHVINTFYTLPAVKNLAARAKASEVTILPEFGMDPGIDLVLLDQAVHALDKVEEIVTYGAGIPEPEAADNPLKYKETWTFEGVIQSYWRAGRVIRDGQVVEIKEAEIFAAENIHEIEIEGLGSLEAYPNGDALRYAELLGMDVSELRTMGRYALRWPGHCAFWKALVDLHLLDPEPVMIGSLAVDRKSFLANAIEPHIQLGPDERDIVIVRVQVSGTQGGQKKHAVYQIIDRRDLQTGFTAMSRTVGYTASIGAQLVGSGQIDQRGVLSPVTDVPYDLLASELEKRGIQITSELSSAQ